ncbi:hypothetical protein [Magnetospirillum sp. ME-1]|uniref:hypothetical protein n=1 Tax=Magnetospirillum sp. ME-1 TaxID=1639348 RepID=UPI0011AE977E|nr:hypothetical protein [Magnetospirillum sp. ME-1]
MTAYENYVRDFPARCLDLLKLAEKPARLKQREVTLALMVASSGFVVPLERLSVRKAHPTRDAATYAESAKNLDLLLSSKFLESLLGVDSNSWRGGMLTSIEGNPDSWSELAKPKPLSKEKTVGGVIRVVRNALAHGNIFTYKNPIDAIVFVCTNMDDDRNITDFSFIMSSPDDFLRFLKGWFGFLDTAHIPAEVAEDGVANAA